MFLACSELFTLLISPAATHCLPRHDPLSIPLPEELSRRLSGLLAPGGLRATWARLRGITGVICLGTFTFMMLPAEEILRFGEKVLD